MNQYQKTTEKKKQAIIQSALSLFKEKGLKKQVYNQLQKSQKFLLCQSTITLIRKII